MKTALDHYLDELGWRLQHLPFLVQQELMREIASHIEGLTRNICRFDPELDPVTALELAITAFCPPDELLVAYGPEGGIIRRSTGECVLRSRLLVSPHRPGRRTWFWSGAAAAGTVAGMVLVLVLASAVMGILAGGERQVPVSDIPLDGGVECGEGGEPGGGGDWGNCNCGSEQPGAGEGESSCHDRSNR